MHALVGLGEGRGSIKQESSVGLLWGPLPPVGDHQVSFNMNSITEVS